MYAIVDVDLWECDALLAIEGASKRYCFSFNPSNYPKLEDAIRFFELDDCEESKEALKELERINVYNRNS